MGFCILGGFLRLKRPHIFGGTKKKTHTHIRKRLGKGTLNTCAKFQGLSKTAWTFGLCTI